MKKTLGVLIPLFCLISASTFNVVADEIEMGNLTEEERSIKTLEKSSDESEAFAVSEENLIGEEESVKESSFIWEYSEDAKSLFEINNGDVIKVGEIKVEDFNCSEDESFKLKLKTDFRFKNSADEIPFELSLDLENWEPLNNGDIVVELTEKDTENFVQPLYIKFLQSAKVAGNYSCEIEFDSEYSEIEHKILIEGFVGEEMTNKLWQVINDNRTIVGSGQKQCTRFSNWMVEMLWGLPEGTKAIYGHGREKVDNLKEIYKDDVVVVSGSLDKVTEIFGTEPKNIIFSKDFGEFGHTGIINEYKHDTSMEGNGYVIMSHGNVNGAGHIYLNVKYTWDEWEADAAILSYAINVNPNPNFELIDLWTKACNNEIEIEVSDDLIIVNPESLEEVSKNNQNEEYIDVLEEVVEEKDEELSETETVEEEVESKLEDETEESETEGQETLEDEDNSEIEISEETETETEEDVETESESKDDEIETVEDLEENEEETESEEIIENNETEDSEEEVVEEEISEPIVDSPEEVLDENKEKDEQLVIKEQSEEVIEEEDIVQQVQESVSTNSEVESIEEPVVIEENNIVEVQEPAIEEIAMEQIQSSEV